MKEVKRDGKGFRRVFGKICRVIGSILFFPIFWTAYGLTNAWLDEDIGFSLKTAHIVQVLVIFLALSIVPAAFFVAAQLLYPQKKEKYNWKQLSEQLREEGIFKYIFKGKKE